MVLVSAIVIARVCVKLYPEVLTILSNQSSCVPDGAPFEVGPSLEHYSTSQLYFVYWNTGYGVKSRESDCSWVSLTV